MAAGRRWWLRAALALLALGLAAAGALAFPALGLAAGYSAKMVCSCVFVAGRSPSACHVADLPGLGWVSLRVDDAAGEVRASALGLTSARARYQAGLGCSLQ